jgi:steroid delta-isomerase-like uncharacterized protein
VLLCGRSTGMFFREDANEFIEAFNDADWERFSATCSADVVYEEKGSNRTVKGRDGVLEAAKGWRTAFPDIRGKIFNSTAEGTTAALEITWMATHNGPLELPSGTLPATNETVEFDAVQVFIVEGGKVTETRHYLDLMTMLSQVGALPK